MRGVETDALNRPFEITQSAEGDALSVDQKRTMSSYAQTDK